MTFCMSPNCTCGRKLTPEIQQAAEKWWNPKDLPEKRNQAPIAVSYFCGGEPEGWPYNNDDEQKG
jgi:hypothetical protein